MIEWQGSRPEDYEPMTIALPAVVTDYSDFDPTTFDPKSIMIEEAAELLGPTLEVGTLLPRTATEQDVDALIERALAAAAGADGELGYVHDDHRTRLDGDWLVVVLRPSVACTLEQAQALANRLAPRLEPGMAVKPRAAA